MRRRRLLFCTSRFPYPAIGGDRQRVFNLVRQLSRCFDVTLLTIGTGDEKQKEQLIADTGVCELHCVPHGPTQVFRGLFYSLLGGEPLQVGYYRSKSMEKRVSDQVRRHDLAIFHLIRTARYWQGQSQIPAVLEMCDAVSENFAQTARQGIPWSPWRLISAIEAPRTSRFERREVARFDLTTLHTHKDAEIVGVLPRNLLISTQGVDLSRFSYRPPSKRMGRQIVLIGRMDFFPNWHGAEWFAREVLPQLPSDVNLKVVGDCSAKIRSRLESIPRVIVTGRVDSIQSACDDAFAAIAPMHVATGIQNKVLEYFAMGLPSVLSPSVASGLLASANGAYISEQSATGWADAVCRIAEAPASFDGMTRLARDYATHEHSWDRIGKEYIDRLNRLFHEF